MSGKAFFPFHIPRHQRGWYPDCMHRLGFLLVFIALAGPARAETFAERLSNRAGWEPIDYRNPEHWLCTGTAGDRCNRDFTMERRFTDGTGQTAVLKANHRAAVDCFYIYPTLDLNIFTAAVHHDTTYDWLPQLVTRSQAGPFSSVCRVFAPIYRQATFGSYRVGPVKGAEVFRKAFVDVAAAFEFYLRHVNRGRPLILLGHSQGAQMVSYLLHAYFDGNRQVTDIPGSRSSAELRKRLVVALPLGFHVYVPRGERTGGAFNTLPLCARADEIGCVVHYRTYAEGHTFEEPWGVGADQVLAREGLLFRAFDGNRDTVACVNPAQGGPLVPSQALTSQGNPAKPGDIRLIGETVLPRRRVFSDSPLLALPGRYTATCRTAPDGGGYLAIGLHAPVSGTDERDDPLALSGLLAQRQLGLHLHDFHVAMGDLIKLAATKSRAFFVETAVTSPTR